MADLHEIGGLPEPDVTADIWADIWYEETHNSTAIEGNTLLLKHVRELLDGGKAVGNKALVEYLEVQGYADAAQWVYSQASDRVTERSDPYVTLTELREIHRRTVQAAWKVEPPEHLLPGEGPGAFRLHEVRSFSGGMTLPPFTDIAPRIADWLRLANSHPADGVHLMEHLGRLHVEFEHIHPFRDGNGRVGRLVLNLLLVRHGLAPAILYKRDRARYLTTLDRGDHGDIGPIAELIARAVKHCLDRFLLPALGGPLQLLPISAVAKRQVSAIALRRAAERGKLRAVRRSTGWYSTKTWVSAYVKSRKGGASRKLMTRT